MLGVKRRPGPSGGEEDRMVQSSGFCSELVRISAHPVPARLARLGTERREVETRHLSDLPLKHCLGATPGQAWETCQDYAFLEWHRELQETLFYFFISSYGN